MLGRCWKFWTKAIRHFAIAMAESADTNGDGAWSSNTLVGGVLNYRTEELDDGTDPVGWYEDN